MKFMNPLVFTRKTEKNAKTNQPIREAGKLKVIENMRMKDQNQVLFSNIGWQAKSC